MRYKDRGGKHGKEEEGLRPLPVGWGEQMQIPRVSPDTPPNPKPKWASSGDLAKVS